MSFIDQVVADATEEMEALIENDDTEVAHLKADDILCELLRDLGYNTLVDAYDEVAKWYA